MIYKKDVGSLSLLYLGYSLKENHTN